MRGWGLGVEGDLGIWFWAGGVRMLVMVMMEERSRGAILGFWEV
jgi:hypothetical protein